MPTAAAGGARRYGRQWVAARTDACTQTRQGVRSSAELDRRMRCLDQRLVELSSVVGGLVEGDARTAAAAVDAVDRVHPVADCDDARETTPQPPSASARKEIAAAEQDLARAFAAEELNQYERAQTLAQTAAEVGRRLGWAPLEARALLLVGECQQRRRRFTESLSTLDRAAAVAASAKDDAVLAEALAQRFFVLDEALGRPADALAGRSFIELALLRAGQPPRLRALWLHFLAAALYGQRQMDDALAAETEAVQMWHKLLRPGSARLLDSLETEANIQIKRKQFAVAETLLREVLAGRIAARGADDPLVASAEDNLGVLAFTRNDMESAIEHWQRAARISDKSGTLNWRVYSNLGAAHTELGQLHAALADYERACATLEREAPGDSAYAGECAASRGAVLTTLGQLERAAPLVERGVELARRTTSSELGLALFIAGQHALARRDLTTAAARVGELARVDRDPEDPFVPILAAQLARARSGCRGARAAIAKAVTAVASDPFHSERLEVAQLSAECHVELGDPARAIAELEPELEWLDEHHADAEAAAPARFTLARALAASGRDVARARALAEAARPALFGRDRDAATQWLAGH